jgi:hypothetical protein
MKGESMSTKKTMPDLREMTPEQRIDFTRGQVDAAERLLREELWAIEELREMWYRAKDALAQMEAHKAEIDALKKGSAQ